MASPPGHFLEGKTIVVAGAGMAGLAFAIALRKHWNPSLVPPTIRIYERDTTETAERRQGFSLSLAGYDETGGLYALKQLGLLEKIIPHVISGLDDSSSFKLWNPDWSQILSVRFTPAAGLPSSGIRIARKNLKKVLLDEAEDGVAITWDAACTSARRLERGKVLVTVSRGQAKTTSEEECDFLVCADGSKSRLRASLRPDDVLQYQGAVQLGGLATFDEIPSPIAPMNWGVATSNGAGVALFASPVDDKSVVWAFSHLAEEAPPPLDPESREQRQAVLEKCLELGSMYGEPFPSLVRATDMDTVFSMPAKDKQPFAHDVSLGSIAFLGDSNHAVSPFAGYGASLALKDGWDLAEQLCKARRLEDAMRAYDTISVPRAKKIIAMSHGRIRDMHAVGVRWYIFKLLSTIGGFFLWLTGRS
ncbi:uncharacterized protein DNG_09020 [Cephalotrichum gorgonifer]|uniref:FAD-binding domain-containing protein n=1 Tax=Cephalotrichum gorgonifer TaxID=2041049 RepID=A0AAE8SYW9_9PEZI|nr:uncharacterized protein DNG_09020 [Cephalotrichum gorgonifer]